MVVNIFNTRKPRKFNHQYMFVDERKMHLRNIEERMQRQLGWIPEKSYSPENLKGVFSSQCRHLSKRKNNRNLLHSRSCVFLMIVLLMLWHYLATGVWRF